MMEENDSIQTAKKALEEMERMFNYQGSDRVVNNREAYDELIKKRSDAPKFSSGLKELDALTDGFESGEVWAITGIQKHGKTTLCDTMAYHMAKQGIGVLWFYYEGNMKYFLEKYQNDDSPMFYVPLQKISGDIKWIEEKVIEAKAKYNCKVVIIDHLHYIADFQRLMKNQSLEMGHVLRYLVQEIASKHDVCIFLVCHVEKVDDNVLVNETHIRDSSFITQETAGVIAIQRKLDEGKTPNDDSPYSNNEAIITVCIARRSGTMREKIRVIKLGHYFHMVEPGYDADIKSEVESMKSTQKYGRNNKRNFY